jgi:hypothetical protein
MVTTARPKMDAAVQTILEVSVMPTFHYESHKMVKFSVFVSPFLNLSNSQVSLAFLQPGVNRATVLFCLTSTG